MTIMEAASNWIDGFKTIRKDTFEEMINNCTGGSWKEVTVPVTGDRVYILTDTPEEIEEEGYVVAVNGSEYTIEFDDGKTAKVPANRIFPAYGQILPLWDNLWSFSDVADKQWLESEEGLRQMTECGFRTYQNPVYGFCFGINGGGYDFLASHFIPLYKARGLQWHDAKNDPLAD